MSDGGLLALIRNRIERAFPERQLFLRAEGEVHYHRFSRRRQIWIAAGLGVVVLWCLFVTGAYFTSDARLSALAQDYERLKADREFALERAREAGRDLLLATMPSHGTLPVFEAQRRESLAQLGTLASLSRELRERVAALSAELDGSRVLKDQLSAARDALMRDGEALRAKLAEAGDAKQSLQTKVASLIQELTGERAEKNRIAAARDDLMRERNMLQQQLADLGKQNSGLQQRSAALDEQLRDSQSARDAMDATRAGLDSRIADLQQKLASVQDQQKALVQRLAARVTISSNAAERTIAMTGLDVNRLLRQVDPKHAVEQQASEQHSAPASAAGMGGPFIAFRPEMVEQASKSAFRVELDRMVAALDKQADRRDGLERILSRLPLAAPLDDYQVMSPFGPRIDPINGKLGFHTGIDLAGAMDAPVLATAAGMVVFAGRNGGYGNVVELDHGMGVRTRYAHLRKILVRVGQKVPLRAQIGIVGTTGRSTGTHVHYEIMVEDQPYDPAKFLRAGLNVFSKD
jgi:murein DD-endopeptidase MepM/ murein hydrolase activator NlpD